MGGASWFMVLPTDGSDCTSQIVQIHIKLPPHVALTNSHDQVETEYKLSDSHGFFLSQQ